MKEHPDNEFVNIDPDSLDEEWCGQAKRYFKYAVKLADAQADLDEANSDLELVRAELEDAIRKSPPDFDLEKVTEPSIASCIIRQSEYQSAVKAVNKAKHRVAILKAAVTALDHRKKALEGMVQLQGQNYFSEPRVKGSTRETMDEITKQSVRQKGQVKRVSR